MWIPCGTVDGFAFARWQVTKDGEVRKSATHRLVKGRHVSNGYIQMTYSHTEDGVTTQHFIQKHRLILGTFKPMPEEKLQCDHRNGCEDFNELPNLRWATPSLNELYKPSKGYTQRGNNWEAQLKVGGKNRSLGTFDNEADAKIAYLIAKSNLIREKSEELISRLILGHGYERAAAIDALNWTEADLDFDSIFQFCVQQ